MRLEIEDIIAQGEKVVHRFTFHGTHRGDFLGFAATGKLVTAPGIHINLFADGKCIEVWSVLDHLSLPDRNRRRASASRSAVT